MTEDHIIFRVDPGLKELVHEVAGLRGERVSDFVRRIIKTELARLSYLTPEEKKALGVLQETPPAAQKQRLKK